MAVNKNGWVAAPSIPTTVIEPIKGVRLRVVKNQDVVEIFTYLVRQFHNRVDDLTKPHPMDDWGFHYRANVNNPSQLSQHAFGKAIDLDATEHPNGIATGKTFSPKQIFTVHEILKELGGLVQWGGDWDHPDGMHFQLRPDLTPQQLHDRWAKIRTQPAKTVVKKTVTQLANEVIAGEWGNAPERKKRLTKAGYDYNAVQAAVQRKLGTKKNVTQVAREVLAGKWGNGAVRISKLRSAGYNVEAVQAEVNRLSR